MTVSMKQLTGRRGAIAAGVMAVGVGAAGMFVVLVVIAILRAVSFDGGLFGFAFPTPGFDVQSPFGGAAYSLSSSLYSFVSILPLGVLGGVLVWLWSTEHRRRDDV